MGNLAWVERAIKWLLWPRRIHGKRGNLHILLSSQCCLDMTWDVQRVTCSCSPRRFSSAGPRGCPWEVWWGCGRSWRGGGHWGAPRGFHPQKRPPQKSTLLGWWCLQGKEKTAVQEPLPDDTGANDHQLCVSNTLPLEVEMHSSAWAACASLPRLTERAVWSLVLAGITPRCPSASFSGLLSSACKTRNSPHFQLSPRNSELMSILNIAIWLQKTHPLYLIFIWVFQRQRSDLIRALALTWPFPKGKDPHPFLWLGTTAPQHAFYVLKNLFTGYAGSSLLCGLSLVAARALL